MANRLAHEVLGRSLDELPPQTRRLLLAVDEMVTAECERQKMERSDYRFSRRDVREATGWGDTQLKTHLHRLEELEYLLVHRGGRGQSIVYELRVHAAEGRRKAGAGRADRRGKALERWLRRKEVGAGGRVVGAKSAPSRRGVGVLESRSSPVSMRLPADPAYGARKNTYTGCSKTGAPS